jgi:AcrR family transcriptional regulator
MDRQKEIIEAARQSFTLFGYKATTMEQVAKLAKVGKGTIYTFFKNKDLLFQEIVLQMINDMKTEVEQVVDPKDTFTNNAHRMLMKILEFREVHKLYGKLIEEERSMNTPEVHAVMKQIEGNLLAYVEERIEAAIQKGEIQFCDKELIAYLLLKAYMAVIIDWSAHHEQELTEERIIALFQNTIFKGLIS